jgi:hypothetical protein
MHGSTERRSTPHESIERRSGIGCNCSTRIGTERSTCIDTGEEEGRRGEGRRRERETRGRQDTSKGEEEKEGDEEGRRSEGRRRGRGPKGREEARKAEDKRPTWKETKGNDTRG